jgi:hypothetical protein
MNTLDALNDAVAARGGRWIKLRTKDDPAIDGEILAHEVRDKRDPDGNVVTSRKSGAPRTEWLFTLATGLSDDGDDDGVRKLAANESMQSAIATAIKASGQKAVVGGRIQVAVSADPEDSYSQATYAAKYTPPAASGVSADDLFAE